MRYALAFITSYVYFPQMQAAAFVQKGSSGSHFAFAHAFEVGSLNFNAQGRLLLSIDV